MQAGTVPVRRKGGAPDGEWEILLVSSQQTRSTWVFPKGGVEAGEGNKDAALRETLEEAGVIGDAKKGSLGKFEYERSGNLVRQKMWLLFVTKEYSEENKRWKERKRRSRMWCSYGQARRKLTTGHSNSARPELLQILDAAIAELGRIDKGETGNSEDSEDEPNQDAEE